MPRNYRLYLPFPDVIFHVNNSGIDQRKIFRKEFYFDFFLSLLACAQESTAVSILVYVLLPQRFDLILHQHEPYEVSLFMKKVEEKYAGWFNKQLHRSGPVFSGCYRGQIVTRMHDLLCLSGQLHLSPVDGRLVASTEDWKYSSYHNYRTGLDGGLVKPSLILNLVGGPSQYLDFLDHVCPPVCLP